jgi:geranyl-CoA carboxylase alpha subunit
MSATPFSTLLIANRGEIARRVIRTARSMGLRTVAVYSEADRGAPHVTEADVAVCLGPAAPAASYLSIAAVIDAARRTGAEAVHPGYGFLAENADFAEACAAAGLVFVGPRPETIRQMADKAAAKAAMAAAGLPCLPGENGATLSEAALTEAAARVGYPVMIKAVAGGGGRGMRLVQEPTGFAAALRSARAEAAAAFGDDRVMLERALVSPRHVEIQVIGDREGRVIHLGERDCSVQRRNQKLIEEAPSPAIGPDLRAEMGEAAARAAAAIGYEGAGTFEFLLDGDGRFYFMEMNTRLQVEHPVTEALTGLDLVALQLRVAAGEKLPLSQAEVRLDGHAIEARLCAEDADFIPQAGHMAVWHPAPGLRVDAGIASGTTIPAQYDSLLAKFVAHAPDRDMARRALAQGLRDTVAFGVETNATLLARVLEHPVFAKGEATTDFLASQSDTLAPPPPAPDTIRLAALLLRATAPGAPLAASGRAPPCEFPVPVRVSIHGQTWDIDVTAARDGRLTAADVTGTTEAVLLAKVQGHVIADLDGVRRHIPLHRDGDRLEFSWAGETWRAEDLSLTPETAHRGASDGILVAPMSGLVRAVHVGAGERIAANTPILSLEAMKMEHDLTLPVSGMLADLHVAPGAQVSAGQILAELTPDA